MEISVQMLTLLMFGSFALLLALGLPLAWTTLGIALLFSLILEGTSFFDIFVYRLWDTLTAFSFIAIPLFIFMANMLRYSGVADDLFDTLYKWMGPLRGGLAMATVAVGAILAAMIGTAGADVTIMGLVALPAMMKRKYNKHMALGSIMAGGILGVMIPPSVMFILYGLVAGESIGKLFMGGVGAGILMATLYIIYIGTRSAIQPNFAPALTKEERQIPLLTKILMAKTLILPLVLILLVLGSIYMGIATPGEAAGIGAAGGVIIALSRRRLNWSNFREALKSALKTTGLIMWIVFGANAFIGVYTFAGGIKFVSEFITGLPLGPWGMLILIQVILIFLGMIIDIVGITMLTVPIFVPIITSLGFDPLWFGILFNMNIQIAYLSPPFGYGMFYMKAVAPKDVTTLDLYSSVWPFIILQVIALVIVMMFPPIATWLPNKMIRPGR